MVLGSSILFTFDNVFAGNVSGSRLNTSLVESNVFTDTLPITASKSLSLSLVIFNLSLLVADSCPCISIKSAQTTPLYALSSNTALAPSICNL